MGTLLRIVLTTAAMALWVGTFPCFAASVVITNPGFETPNLGSGFQYDPTGPGVGWTFITAGAGITANGSFGVGGPGSGQSGSLAPAPEGTQVGLLQSTQSEIFQSLSGFTVGGTYSFTFLAAQRPTSLVFSQDLINAFPQTIEVLLDSPSSARSLHLCRLRILALPPVRSRSRTAFPTR